MIAAIAQLYPRAEKFGGSGYRLHRHAIPRQPATTPFRDANAGHGWLPCRVQRRPGTAARSPSTRRRAAGADRCQHTVTISQESENHAPTDRPPGSEGYGYLWWLYDGNYAARGIFGQHIRIDPTRNLVIAVHSNAPAAVRTPHHDHSGAASDAIRPAF